jgi:cytochrome c oxidase cbb3-type subunit 3
MGHADEADGIEEYDNPLPDWWLGLFWLCILWAIGYTVHYHFIANRSQEARFEAEMAAAAAMFPAAAAADVVFAMTPEAIAGGEGIFTTYCVACHGQNLEGFIGPNLLDDEWIHGNRPENLVRVIREGVLEKGMTPWEGILTPEQMNHAAAYVLSKNAEAQGRSIEELEASWEESGGGEGGTEEGAAEGAGGGSVGSA